MKRSLSSSVIGVLALAACNGQDEVAYIQQWDRVQVVLDDERPSRTWDLQVETNVEAARDGLTWTTVDADADVYIEPMDPWVDQFVHGTLTGEDDVDDDAVQFVGPGLATIEMRQRYEADCVAGEPCAWSYLLMLARGEGSTADVALDISIRALVTLGTVAEASVAAGMTIEAVEIEPEE